MITTPVACVIDASVGIELVVAEALSAQSHALFAHLAADPADRFWVPDLFYIECTNILWKHVRAVGLSACVCPSKPGGLGRPGSQGHCHYEPGC
jgi:predicted nucleic acid-binding protein